MISTVTVSTVTTVTTAALAGSVALIGILVLFGLLLQKEVTVTSSNRFLRRLGAALDIGIIPLLIAFILILMTQAVDFMR
jgi:hypothetical protein